MIFKHLRNPDIFLGTLRNIELVRKRITYGQQRFLARDSKEAIKTGTEIKTDISGVEDRSRFMYFYTPYIATFPSRLDFAITQGESSSVAINTCAK